MNEIDVDDLGGEIGGSPIDVARDLVGAESATHISWYEDDNNYYGFYKEQSLILNKKKINDWLEDIDDSPMHPNFELINDVKKP